MPMCPATRLLFSIHIVVILGNFSCQFCWLRRRRFRFANDESQPISSCYRRESDTSIFSSRNCLISYVHAIQRFLSRTFFRWGDSKGVPTSPGLSFFDAFLRRTGKYHRIGGGVMVAQVNRHLSKALSHRLREVCSERSLTRKLMDYVKVINELIN